MVAPIIATVAIPLIEKLFSEGLSLLGSAVLAKGQDVVEKELGVKLDTASSETLRKLELEHEDRLIEFALEQKKLDMQAELNAQNNVTDRWKSDMLSDSRLSKNIRPGVLIYLLLAFTLFAVSSAFDVTIQEVYITLLGQMLIMVMSAYFVGRSIEKGIDIYQGHKIKNVIKN